MFIDLGHINFLVDPSLIWIYVFFTCSQTQNLVIWSWLPKRYFSVPQTSGVHLLSSPLRSYFHHFSPPRLTFLETLLTPSPSTFGQLPNVIGISFIVGFSFVFSFLEHVPLLPPIFSSIILWTSSREKLLLGCLNVTYPSLYHHWHNTTKSHFLKHLFVNLLLKSFEFITVNYSRLQQSFIGI